MSNKNNIVIRFNSALFHSFYNHSCAVCVHSYASRTAHNLCVLWPSKRRLWFTVGSRYCNKPRRATVFLSKTLNCDCCSIWICFWRMHRKISARKAVKIFKRLTNIVSFIEKYFRLCVFRQN